MANTNKTYYHFNRDETLGYVGEAKMKRMIKGWGWKRSDFIEKSELLKLFRRDKTTNTVLPPKKNV